MHNCLRGRRRRQDFEFGMSSAVADFGFGALKPKRQMPDLNLYTACRTPGLVHPGIRHRTLRLSG